MRFPEFCGEWKEVKLSKVIKVQGGYAFKSELFQQSGVPIIRISNLPQNELFVNLNDCVYYSEGNYHNFEVHKGDLLIAMSGATTGKTAIYNNNSIAYLNQRVGCFKVKSDLFYSFLYALVETKSFKNQLNKKLIAGAQPNISSFDIESIKVTIPGLIEQQKIAKLIGLLNERIDTQNKIIEKLETLIKGIIETVISSQKPNTLIKNCLECNSSTLQESQVAENGNFPVYGATGISGYTETADINGESILIIKDGSGVGSVKFVTGEYSYIGTLNSLTVKDGYCLKYIYFALQGFSFEPYKTGMAIPHIYFKDYGKAKIYCPPYKLQATISQQLTCIESKIDVEKRILSDHAQQKSYLLSQMFI